MSGYGVNRVKLIAIVRMTRGGLKPGAEEIAWYGLLAVYDYDSHV